ncbi:MULTISPECIES: hypothetical protein [Clostridium]|uniref:Uncharacterized protein n=2 Tax=Clostridium TaxID=1485 RepID=A0A9W5Y0X9_9CLOT|nr:MULTISPECIES: hypothetical protein [Clostridium]GFZ33748.1 hypothetical protein CSC2_42740 [Clostridium zeae]GKU24492.1 hypothetical protein CFOLD11_13180 [Clostridium folliculivorans]GKU30590.1 hypothetical protein CFB3_26970 [Clostridium folliculivorans]
MDENELIESLSGFLETNGEVKIIGEDKNITIQSADDNPAYAYVSNTHKRFENSTEAIEWAVEQFDGAENIEEWE